MAATIKDIATRTGLGLATISKYLNGGTVRPQNKKCIEQAISELNYVPNEFARSLKTKQSLTIGVIIPELSNTFITSIITTMQDILWQNGYAVMVCDCRTDPKREAEAVQFLRNKRVDGIINMPTDITGNHLKPLLLQKTPVVLVDRMISSLTGQLSAVVVDNIDASKKAVSYLVENGHKDVGILLGNEQLYTTKKRLEGYIMGLKTANISPKDELIVYSDYTMHGGYLAMKSLLQQKNPPTAVFITNYEMTIGAMIAINELHINIPEQLSIIGFDKLDLFGAIYPNLTLIKQPQHAIGKCVANQMLAMLGVTTDEGFHHVITLPAQLQKENSVKKLTNNN